MESSWFDDAVDLGGLTPPRRGVIASSRWTASVSHRLAFLEEFDMQELEATSSRLRRESARLVSHRSNLCTDFASRRIDLAQRFNNLMRNSGAGSRYHIDEDESLSRDLQAIKDENLKLQAVITDVTEVNKKWQKYNNDRQMYVQRLLSTIQDQQEQMNKTIESKGFLSNESLRDSTENSEVLTEKFRLEEELSQQRRRLENLEKDHREHVAVLEFQMKAHRDDWEMERSEKQQVLKDKLAAETKVRQLQKDVRCLKLKLREERLENANHCSCCISQACEPDVLTSASKLSPCRRDHTMTHNKTYRTSVHLPCTSGHLLPRGTTLCFGDEDLVIDNEETAMNNLSKHDLMEVTEQQKHGSMDNPELALCSFEKEPEPKEDTSSSRNLRKKSFLSKSQNSSGQNVPKSLTDSLLDSKHLPKHPDGTSNEKVHQSVSQPNLTTSPKVSCSVLHIQPSESNSSVSLATESVVTESTDVGSGVTIGFSSNGLATVFSFPQTPIVKSFSLPTPNVGAASSHCQLPSSQPSSCSSSQSDLPVTPSQTHASSAESLFQDKKSSKLSLLGAFAKSMKQSKESFSSEQVTSTETLERREQTSSQRAATWKATYFENGVATQTKEDLICPSCGQIFPPIQHVKFLDHFEKCQSIKN